MSLSIREAIRTMRQSGWSFEDIRKAVATVELDEVLDATQPMPPLTGRDVQISVADTDGVFHRIDGTVTDFNLTLDAGEWEFGTD